jgi:2-polyprenyl-3-methyl-5-hydroxy-6-metoxy-1,4-benzoquinol methylase
MMRKQWYVSLFQDYGKTYDSESFTQGTSGECDFIEKELNFNKSLKILDVGCGTDRHSIKLTKRGYNIEFTDDFGNKKTLECNERYYIPSEITWLLKSLGYKKI